MSTNPTESRCPIFYTAIQCEGDCGPKVVHSFDGVGYCPQCADLPAIPEILEKYALDMCDHCDVTLADFVRLYRGKN